MCTELEACLRVRTVGTSLVTGPNCTDILRNTTAPSTGNFSRAGFQRLTFGSLLERASSPVWRLVWKRPLGRDSRPAAALVCLLLHQ